ncbi:MAG: histidinol-phosphatase, partial [Candidatus Marinimicrobia bacterium]|nr:histidinol-phosphatase [Candidatus Neomarinimicrobiota bacterium]
RERFGIIGQLGFIPDELALDALEVSPIFNSGKAELNFPQAPGFPLVTFSDAHFLEDIGKGSTTFLIKEPKVYEIKKALLDKDGRKILMKN